MAKKTKLTSSLRGDIKAAIMADIPFIDYISIIQDYLNRKAWEQLPVELQEERFQEYIGSEYIREFERYVPNACYKPSDEDRRFVAAQRELQAEQNDKFSAARRSVTSLLDSFNYVEDLVAAAPEFEAYVPKKEVPIINLPATRITEQLHSLGWPKSGEGK
jgi:hypothetical protein